MLKAESFPKNENTIDFRNSIVWGVEFVGHYMDDPSIQ